MACARGRQSIVLTDQVAEHFDRCLGCMACVTACPSGVQYDRLIEQARASWSRSAGAGRCATASLRAALFAVLPHRRRLRAALALRRLPAPGPLAALKRVAPPWSSPAWPPEHTARRGPARRARSPAACRASSSVTSTRQPRGCSPRRASTSTCRARRAAAARCTRTRGAWRTVSRARRRSPASSRGYDHIVTNAAGCGSHLKDHGVEGAVDVSRAARASRVRPRHPLAISVAFQDSCHLRHAQGITSQPRAMLDSIPGLRRLEPADQDLCCGSAGIYNIVQPDAAATLGERKARAIIATGADAYASANPGCLVQVSAALRRLGSPLPAFHPIELLDASIRGVEPDRLLQGGPQMTDDVLTPGGGGVSASACARVRG